jgi:transposase InsO family protein
VPHDVRDQVVDFVRHWTEKTELPTTRLVHWLGIARSKFFQWTKRYGRINEHNAWVPRDHWLSAAEKTAILDFHQLFPLEGYRRLAFMMLDRDLVAVSPSSVYRVLRDAGLLRRSATTTRKGTGFQQPLTAHEHWHVDVSYLNIRGTFYFLCSVLDGYSRSVLHWDVRESMKEREIEVIVQTAREKFPGVAPRIISDNGPQFIAKEFKTFVRLCGMTHVRTSPYYPQSNGKIEAFHREIKRECIRPRTPLSLEDAKQSIDQYVSHYNEVRLHGALGYITPKDQLEGKAEPIFAERDRKLAAARARRTEHRAAVNKPTSIVPVPTANMIVRPNHPSLPAEDDLGEQSCAPINHDTTTITFAHFRIPAAPLSNYG